MLPAHLAELPDLGPEFVLRGGLVIDGTGRPGRVQDVAISQGRICTSGEPDWPVVDVAGLVIAPGFVDIHTHSDLTLLSAPLAPSAVHQGVTTQVVGNCGLGMAPRGTGVGVDELRAVNSYLDRDPQVATDWPTLADQLQAWRQQPTSINLATLAAHIPLHASVAGLGSQPATPEQVQQIADLADEALNHGAVGISTGLIYAPVSFCGEDELLALGRVAAAHDAVFAWHVKDYIDDLLPSVEQALRVARLTGCRTQISHLQCVGQRNWPGFEQVMVAIEQARAEGLDVAIDMYPYLAGNSLLAQVLPAWVQDGGDAGLRATLADPDQRARARAEMVAPPGPAFGHDEILIAACPDPQVVGRTVAQMADQRGLAGVDAALDLLAEHGTSIMMTAFGRSPEILARTLAHEACVVASDGQALDPEGVTGHGQPHPRSYGCYPAFLSQHDQLGLSLEEAVRRCTSAPADRVGLPDRGRIAPGLPADLVLFDPATIADRASYTEPQTYPAGIAGVLVNGVAVVVDSCHTGARPGQVLTSRPATASPAAPDHPSSSTNED